MLVGGELREETRAFNEQLRQLLAGLPPLEAAPAEATRRARYDGRGIFPAPVFVPEARWIDVPSRAGRLRVRVIPPENGVTGVYLHVHGGGWTLGAADLQDVLLSQLARATGVVVASVEYRLAPEHPYPAAVDDCEDAASWLLDVGAAELGASSEQLAIGGESAGAHLAALTLLRLRAARGETGFRAANLAYGAYDLSGTPSRRAATAETLVLTDSALTWFTENFVAGVALEGRRDPAVSPLYADLRRLPPALFTVGTADPLLDDSLFMAARWRAAGNPAELRVYEDGVHGFNAFPIALGRLANEAQVAFLRETLIRERAAAS